MKKIHLLLLLLLPQLIWAQDGLFVENKGQWDAKASFRMSVPSGFVFVEQGAITYKIFHPDYALKHPGHEEGKTARKTDNDVIGHVLRAHFLNTQGGQLQGQNPSNTRFNYYIGQNPNQWASNAKGYQTIQNSALYPHINLQFYLNYGHLKVPTAINCRIWFMCQCRLLCIFKKKNDYASSWTG